MAPASGC
eukprot:CCRYP_007574-RB/>CCRYP_007574-RB protein AED:0.47 eAED:0.47 QI:0/-1/0/1/-1/0/1/0/7